MKNYVGLLMVIGFLAFFSSCSTTTVRKPEKLIPKARFEKMMVDIYLLQGFNSRINRKEDLKKVSMADLYYSVLKKYEVSDTVFISSLVYYSSFPKEFEKMQNRIMDNLNESEEQFFPKDKLKMGKE